MNLIQLILLLSLVFSMMIVFFTLRKQLLGLLFFAVQFFLGAVCVIYPELTSIVARKLGVGRGVDLILYCFIILFYLTMLAILGKFRQLERKLTVLVRKMALLEEQLERQKTHPNG